MIRELKDRAIKLLGNCSKNDDLKLMRLKLIEKILSDENCFFKMSLEDAYNILLDLDYSKEDALKIYSKIISYENYLKVGKESIVDSE